MKNLFTNRLVKVCAAMFGAASLLVGFACAQVIPGAQGFGAQTIGGTGGQVIYVTSLSDDNPDNPVPGTLRWAVEQTGPRIIKFQVAGTIALKDRLDIENPYVTIDGSDAPGDGICLKDYSVNIRDTNDVVVRYIRIRRGDVALLAYLDANGLERPVNSSGLDCVGIDRSSNVLFDHVSLSWSCDEIFGITKSQNVTIQWCIISEPLSNSRIHPYGDNHAFGLNISASTVSVHHSLIAHYVFRGPQFEANDTSVAQGYDVQLESVNNLIFNYERSGSRYSAGIETDPANAVGINFKYHFVNNRYMNPSADQPDIEVITKHGTVNTVKAYVSGNIGPNRINNTLDQWSGVFLDDDNMTNIRQASVDLQSQISTVPLFTPAIPVVTQAADAIFDLILDNAGCSIHRDAVDARIVNDVRTGNYKQVISSQADVGGWPDLASSLPTPWQQVLIGSPGIAGSGTHASGTYTLATSGDIKGNADRFRFMYQQASGNCEIIARVMSVQNVDPDAAAGVMIRDDLSSDESPFAAMLITAANGGKARRRFTPGGSTSDTTVSVSAPEWVRVKRSGDTFTLYRGGDGVNWTQVQSVNIDMGSTVYIGLVAASDDDGQLCTAVLSNVSATP